MTTLASSSHATRSHAGPMGWFSRAEAWLDDRGRGAWIAAMVLAFIFVWPVGLALLAYMIWSGKMSCSRTKRSTTTMRASRSSGNSAFDAYRDDTLQRLEQEQEAFVAFLDRLRAAKDKAEFDQFMDDRAKSAGQSSDDDAPENRPETREA